MEILFLILVAGFVLCLAVNITGMVLLAAQLAYCFVLAPIGAIGSWWRDIGEHKRMLAREKRRRQARIRKAQQPYDQERSDENIAYWRAQLQQQGAAPKP